MYRYLRRLELLTATLAIVTMEVPVIAAEAPLTILRGSAASVWLNSAPLDDRSLRGKVVLVDFWTYSCINSLRNLPYLKAWSRKYAAAGLVVIGVHTPEFSFEKEHANVTPAVRSYGVTYPVVMDSDYRIWHAFDNDAWPGDYLIDGNGRIRYRHFGEGDYAKTERIIQQVLTENGAAHLPSATVDPHGEGIEAAADFAHDRSPETYVGYARTENFASPEGHGGPRSYTVPERLPLNHWGLAGTWTVGAESAVLESTPGSIAFRFHSRDLHLVLLPAANGAPVRYRVTLDGSAPGHDHGLDVADDGTGTVREPRLYQLVRQTGSLRDRTFRIEFLDAGVRAFVFTFG